ncbi:MAG TPA: hypothetical protein VH439_02615 [Gemmatimonadales bacterium]
MRAAGEAHASGEITLIAPALFAYAMYLEQESHFEEAEDALQTMLDVAAGRLQSSDAISAWMRLGRVRRKQTNFDGADHAYAEAARLAERIGDRHSVLLSAIGHCNVLYFRGNIPQAEQQWRVVLADANAGGDRVVEAQAHHGLGNLLQRRGLAHAGVPHLWKAYGLYEDDNEQVRVLNDLGIALLSIGDVHAAERALTEVVRRDRVGDNHTNSLIELMQCASYRRDRLAFERVREDCLKNLDIMAPNIRADYYLKVGIGLARFGSFVKAETNLTRALEIASAHDLHELVFRIGRIRDGLRECDAPDDASASLAELDLRNDAVREVSASLTALSASV